MDQQTKQKQRQLKLSYRRGVAIGLSSEGVKVRKAVKPTRAARFVAYDVSLGDVNDLDRLLTPRFAARVAYGAQVDVNSVSVRQGTGVVRISYNLPDEFIKTYTRKQLISQDSLGVIDPVTQSEVPFSWDALHKLFTGETGSGKTVAIKSGLMAWANMYSPEDLDVVICSPHALADFVDNKEKIDFSKMPHLSLDIAYTKEAISRAVQSVYDIYQQRKVENHTEANGKAKKLVLVIDEITEDEVFGMKPSASLEVFSQVNKLASGGRKYNIRLIVGIQVATKAAMGDMIRNIPDVYVGKANNAATSALVSGVGGLNAHKLGGKGDFWRSHAGDQVRFQIAALDNGTNFPPGTSNLVSAPIYTAPSPEPLESGQGGNVDVELLGRIFGAMMFRRDWDFRPGSSYRKRWGVNQSKLVRHLAQIDGFVKGFLYEYKGEWRKRST